MKVLTVQQPWAWAIIHGGKDVENRTTPWRYRGPLAIHAGARWSDRGAWSSLVWGALERYGWPTGPDTARRDPRPGFDSIRPLGAIIGTVDLVDVHEAMPELRGPAMGGLIESACCESPWAEQQYVEHGGRTRRSLVHLVLEDPTPVVPVFLPGRLGLWDLPDDVTLVTA